MSESVLITPRRNFLVRALGFTAAGAAMTVPIVTVASAEERLKHHIDGAVAAFRDLFPGLPIVVRGNAMDGNSVASYARLVQAALRDKSLNAFFAVMASEGWAGEP